MKVTLANKSDEFNFKAGRRYVIGRGGGGRAPCVVSDVDVANGVITLRGPTLRERIAWRLLSPVRWVVHRYLAWRYAP